MFLRKSALYSVGSNAFQFGVQFIASVIVARLLMPDEMGVFTIAIAAYGLLFAFQNIGLVQYVTNHDDMSPRRLGGAMAMSAAQGVLLALVLILVAWGLSVFMEDPRIFNAVAILALVALLLPTEHIPMGLLQREMRFDHIAIVLIARTLANTSVTVAGAYFGLSYASMAWGALAGSLVGGVIGVVLCAQKMRVRPNTQHWREIGGFGLSMLSFTSITNIASRSSVVVLGKVADITSVGHFGRATGITDMVQFGLIEPLGRLVLPSLANARRADGGMGDMYRRAASVLTIVSWPAFAGLAVLSHPLIAFIYGERWLPAAPALIWLCIARIFVEMATCPVEVSVASNQMPRLTRLAIVKSGIGFAAFSIGASFGLVWAAFGRTVEALAGAVLYLPFMLRATELKWGALLSVWRTSAIATAAAIGPAFFWMASKGWPDTLPILEMAGVIVLGVICWIAALAAVRHEIWVQICRGSQFLLTKARARG